MRRLTIVVADRHPMVLRSLVNLLSPEKGFEVVATCCDNARCIELIQVACPDIALVDILMPGTSGLEALIAASAPSYTQVVFLAVSASLRRLIAAGRDHPTPRGDAALIRYLRQIMANRRLIPIEELRGRERPVAAPSKSAARSLALLTARESQIAHLVSAGLSNREVGNRLNISEGTVKIHLHHIYEKLTINNRTSLVTLAREHPQPDAAVTKSALPRSLKNSE